MIYLRRGWVNQSDCVQFSLPKASAVVSLSNIYCQFIRIQLLHIPWAPTAYSDFGVQLKISLFGGRDESRARTHIFSNPQLLWITQVLSIWMNMVPPRDCDLRDCDSKRCEGWRGTGAGERSALFNST